MRQSMSLAVLLLVVASVGCSKRPDRNPNGGLGAGAPADSATHADTSMGRDSATAPSSMPDSTGTVRPDSAGVKPSSSTSTPPSTAPKQPSAAVTTPSAPAAAPSAATKSASATPPANSGTEMRDAYHTAPLDTVDGKTYQGWKMFNLNCARCHGEDVSGTTIAPHLIVSLKPNGPIPDEATFTKTVCDGRVEKGMPAWCSTGMTKEEIDTIYAYVKGRSDAKLHPGRPARKP